MSTQSTPVPLYLLCGPLGAGKTTLLLQLLRYWQRHGVRAGVLMNEAGAVSVDGPTVGRLVEDVREVSGGCVCCDARGEIGVGLKELVVDCRVEVVVLECSGMASVGDVIDVITEPLCRPLVELARIIAVVQPAPMPEGRMIGARYTDCVRYADDIVLNKRDLCPLMVTPVPVKKGGRLYHLFPMSRYPCYLRRFSESSKG